MNLKPPAPETNALPLSQQAGALIFVYIALVPDAQVPSKDLPSAKTPVPGTPGSAATNRFNFVTPATARRKKRPLNVDAILKSAQKVISESPRPKTPAHTSSLETDERAEVPPTPQNSQQALRAASTPRKNFSFSLYCYDLHNVAFSVVHVTFELLRSFNSNNAKYQQFFFFTYFELGS